MEGLPVCRPGHSLCAVGAPGGERGLQLGDNPCPQAQRALACGMHPGNNPNVLNFPLNMPPRSSDRSTRSLKLSETCPTWLLLSWVGHTLAAWGDPIPTSTFAFTIARHAPFSVAQVRSVAERFCAVGSDFSFADHSPTTISALHQFRSAARLHVLTQVSRTRTWLSYRSRRRLRVEATDPR
jgi:hypothetical protein